MKNFFKFIVLSLFIFSLLSFSIHKFYTAIYKIEFNAPKKRIEITTRIFTDDLNAAIFKKYNYKSAIGSAKETSDDIDFLKKYLNEKVIIKVNGKIQNLRFLSKERDENVLICYFNSDNVSKIKTFEINNSVLTEIFQDQQNIVQLNISSKKQTILMTSENTKGMLK